MKITITITITINTPGTLHEDEAAALGDWVRTLAQMEPADEEITVLTPAEREAAHALYLDEFPKAPFARTVGGGLDLYLFTGPFVDGTPCLWFTSEDLAMGPREGW